jgi:hypothetical protein
MSKEICPKKGSSMDLAPAVRQGRSKSVIIFGDRKLAEALNRSISTVRTWRAKRLIPFMRMGYKSIAYELPDVLASLRSLRVKPITEKEVR